MEYIIRGIPAEGIGAVWRFAEPFIKRALDHTFGELSVADIRQFCENRDMQLWMVVRDSRVVGAGTTQIVTYPKMKACRIVTLAGTEFDQWKNMAHTVIEAWAMEQKCGDMEAYVRKGFMSKLQEIGYKWRYSVAHKCLGE